MKTFTRFLFFAAVFFAPSAWGQSFWECRGTATPYPAPEERVALPDSLRLVAVSHAGRHGARFASSAKRPEAVARYLQEANAAGRLTPRGERLLQLVNRVIRVSENNWGALDSLGMAEQEGIARRLYRAWPYLFDATPSVSAVSSYVPRCVMSMDCFTHALARCRPQINIRALSGPELNTLMRPFQVSAGYLELMGKAPWKEALSNFEKEKVPLEPARRMVGDLADADTTGARKFTLDMFGFLAGLNASGLPGNWLEEYFTIDEARNLWAVNDAKQYFTHSASGYSRIPALIAAPLLKEMVSELDRTAKGVDGLKDVIGVSQVTGGSRMHFHFGHAETMMPLLALIGFDGCRYLTGSPEEAAAHWRNYAVAPMAVNLQLLLCRSGSGAWYLRADLNEIPVKLPGAASEIVSWEEARKLLSGEKGNTAENL